MFLVAATGHRGIRSESQKACHGARENPQYFEPVQRQTHRDIPLYGKRLAQESGMSVSDWADFS
jgi:hypothetical protein